MKIILIMAHTYIAYYCTHTFVPILVHLSEYLYDCITFTSKTPQILPIQFSLL